MILFEYSEPVTFLERLTRITDPTIEQLVPWKLDSYQRRVVRDRSRFKIVNKSRKAGISTAITGWAFHTVLTEPNVDIAMVSTAERIAYEMMDKVKGIANTLPASPQTIRGLGL